MRTKVMNVRTCRGDPRQIDGFEYVGRRVARSGYRGSPYANPYKPDFGDDKFLKGLDCVLMFTSTLSMRSTDQADYLDRLRRKLHGKYLGCWCTEWDATRPMTDPCHAIPLALVADGADPLDVMAWLMELRKRYAAEGMKSYLLYRDFVPPALTLS